MRSGVNALGSAVSAVSWQEHLIKAEGMGWNYSVTGEAVVVEVAPGRYLFALLKGPHANYLGSVAPASIAGREGRVIDPVLFDEVRDKRDRAAGVITVPDYQYPMLVTFADISDPASVQLVDPDDLAASFGPGVRLKAVVLEVTREPVTEGKVEAVLGDLDSIGRSGPKPIEFPPGYETDQLDPNEKSLSVLTLSTEVYK